MTLPHLGKHQVFLQPLYLPDYHFGVRPVLIDEQRQELKSAFVNFANDWDGVLVEVMQTLREETQNDSMYPQLLDHVLVFLVVVTLQTEPDVEVLQNLVQLPD